MNRNMDAVANTNTKTNHDPDFKTFWKQLHGKELPPKIVFNTQCPHVEQIDCYSITPKRMEYWDMAIEAGFTFPDLESMERQHNYVAFSPHVLLSDSNRQGYKRMRIGSLTLDFSSDGQLGEEDKQAIRFVLRLATEHPPESSFDEGISLSQCFVKMKQLHDIPLVTHRVELDSCDLVDCDKLMFNISQNSKWVEFRNCRLANGGADLCRWVSPNNCRVTEISFVGTRVTCDSLAKLFQSNKHINKLNIIFCMVHSAQQFSSQEIDQIIKLLSDASHLKELTVFGIWNGLSRQEQDTWFDILISLLGNKSLSSLTYSEFWNPAIFGVWPETPSAQMEALEQALEQTTQLVHLNTYPHPPDEHAHSYDALVERILQRNHRNKVRVLLGSLPTWSRPQALFGEMLMRTNKCGGAMGTMDPMSEAFHVLLQGSDTLKQAWDDKRSDRLVRVDDASACDVEKKDTSMIDAILDGLRNICSSSN